MARGTKKKKEPRVIPGTSDYVVRENAARKQLGVAGLAARNKQVPKAARATARGLLREVTGIDVSRKGVKVDPMGIAMALPVGKVLKAAKALRAAGNIGKADALTARVVAKAAGGSRAAARAQKEQRAIAVMRPEWPGVFGPSSSRRAGDKARGISERLFPRSGEGLFKKPSKEAMERVATKGFTKSEIDSFTDYAEKYYADQARLRAKFGKGK